MYVRVVDKELDYISLKLINEKHYYYLLWSYQDKRLLISKKTIQASELPWIEFDFNNFDKMIKRIDKLLVFS